MSNEVHLKGLNGIRAIAALSVVISHILQNLVTFGLPGQSGIELASYGVTMFFTLSGFLITFLLLLEKEKYRDVNIRQFYVRRILRIWPLYYFYLLVSILVLFIYNREELTGYTWFYFLLLANVPYILEMQVPVIGHYWSLGVEEQFYLFWPWVVKKVNKLFNWLFGFVILLLLLKLLFWIFYRQTGNPIPLATIHHTRFDCMAIGACGALLYHQRHTRFLRFAYALPTQLLMWGAIAVIALNKFHINRLINDELVAGITVLLIMNVSSNPKTLIRFDNWYMDYLGKISYGIYVYHPLVIFLAAKCLGSFIKTFDSPYNYMIIYVIVVGMTILIADLSYRFFESPFLRMKKKFSRIHSAGNREEVTVPVNA